MFIYQPTLHFPKSSIRMLQSAVEQFRLLDADTVARGVNIGVEKGVLISRVDMTASRAAFPSSLGV